MWIEGFGRLPGNLIVISGPSGAGKSTIIGRLLEQPGLCLRMSVSATTRAPRAGEIDGTHYFFATRDEFLEDIQRGAFLEYATYNNHLYGTPLRPLYEWMSAGESVILEIEVEGARQVREKAPLALFVFIDVPEFAALEPRLRARGTEDDAAIHRRLVHARRESAERHWYDVRIVNDDPDRAVAELVAVLRNHGCGGNSGCSMN
jgi:guanylate kinase